MADEPALPSLVWDEPAANSRPKRGRMIPSSPPTYSSDPVFSSDDDPSVDNYTSERRKRRYLGPWFQQRPEDENGQPVRPRKTKRRLQRKLDSGIFMGSDCTDASVEDLPFNQQELGRQSQIVGTVIRPRLQTLQLSEPSPEQLVQQEIERCLEEGIERIDLSSRNLTHLSNHTIKPLSTFACVPLASQEELFRPLTPALKVFLSSNNLQKLPGELFKLERLSVLSLRNNLLQELPSVIDSLSDLVELNIANNRLRYLPYELLRLFSDAGKLQNLTIHPNPFYEPAHAAADVDATSGTGLVQVPAEQSRLATSPPRGKKSAAPLQSSSPWRHPWKLSYKCRSHVRYLDIDGSLLAGPLLSDRENDRGSSVGPSSPDSALSVKIAVALESDVSSPPTAGGRSVSKAPSLLETVLRNCGEWNELPQLRSMLSADTPVRIQDAVALAEAVMDAGGRRCSVCKRAFITARTEWIEWWEISKVQEPNIIDAVSPSRRGNQRDQVESLVPLMRRGCSWVCRPLARPC